MAPIEEDRPSRPALSTQSSSSSMSSLRKQAMETSALSFAARSSVDGKRLKRKRSFQSRRKPSVESDDWEVDREILELNTIVEERRAEAARPQSPDNEHISAIAPTMPIRARSETLTSIGSALSRPLTTQPVLQNSARLSRPFTNMPEPIIRPNSAQPMIRSPSRSSNRVSGWLTDLLSQRTNANAEQQEQQQQHVHASSFYKCVPAEATSTRPPRPTSEASFCTTVTESESPALTVASSPTSKAHSRSLTAESRITPAMEYDLDPRKVEESARWPIVVDNASQVGLAL